MKLIPLNTDLQSDAAFVALPSALQSLVFARLDAVREIHSAPNKTLAVAVVARRNNHAPGWKDGTVRNFYYAMTKERDWRVLLDYARAGLKRRDHLGQADLTREFCLFLGSQWSHRQRGKFRAAYVDLKAQYRHWRDTGDDKFAIPGYDRCPEMRGGTGLPEGWSECNLRRVARKHASRAARKLINIGPKAGHNDFSYKIPTTRAGVEVGQYILFDDCWNDFRVLYRGKGSRILTLHALDLASGCNVMRGHKPTVEDERQVEERLKEREMLFLVAAYLSNIGYRPAGTFFVCEKGTATIRTDEATLLDQITDGAIRVETGPAAGGPGIAGLFNEGSGGNPRWKASIESFFNLLHNRCDHLLEFPGQTGKNSRLDKPEGLERMEIADEQLFRAMQILTPERQQLIRFNLLQYKDAAPALDARVEFCNTRRDHALEGWADCGHVVPAFRLHPQMDFIPFAKTSGMREDQLEMLRLLLASDPRLTGETVLSPREVFDNGAGRLRKFTPAQTACYMARIGGDERPVKRGLIEVGVPDVNPNDPLSFGPVIRDFQGTETVLSDDAKYNVRVNPYDPRYAWLYNARDGFCGIAPRRLAAGTRGDAEALQRHFKAKAKQFSPVLAEARELAAPITQRISDNQDANAAAFHEQADELSAPDRAMDRRARREKQDFSALGGGENVTAKTTQTVTMEEMNKL